MVAVTGIDVDGLFRLKTPSEGTYFVRISAMGFLNQDLPGVLVKGPSFSYDFGKVALKPDVKVLREVTVQNLRPALDVQADKIVVSVEGMPLTAGSTVYEVLARSPGVWIDQEGNIQLNGREGAQVMIDGKLTYLNGRQLLNLLQSMPAENLKNLEIIANPSARFDAEGSAGILNINLKKNTLTGLNGSVYGGYQFNIGHAVNAGSNLNFKKGRWSSFVTADIASRPQLRDFYIKNNFTDPDGSSYSMDMQGRTEGRQLAPSLRLGTDYDLNKQHSLGGAFSLTRSITDTRLLNIIASSEGPSNTINDDANRFNSATLNLHYLGKLDTAGTTLSADLDVVKITNQRNGLYYLQKGAEAYGLENLNPTSYQIYAAKADYTLPLPALQGKFEAGTKASLVRSDNKVDYFDRKGLSRIENPGRNGDHFLYDEYILAAYASTNLKLGSHITLQAGLRSEYTSSKGYSVPRKEPNPRKYLDFFPSIFLQQHVSDKYQVAYSYSRRINRPRYESLNPAVFFMGSVEGQGNPELRPQYTSSFQVTQTLLKTYNLILGYAHNKDAVSEVAFPDVASRKNVFRFVNILSKDISGTLVVPITATSYWNFSNNLTVAYQIRRTPIQNNIIVNEIVRFSGQTRHNLSLPNDFKLELVGGYQGPGGSSVFRTRESYWIDLGLKKSFLNKDLEATLSATDIFGTRDWLGITEISGSVNEYYEYWFAQSVRLNLRYRFLKGEKFEMKRRGGNLDELNRAGG